MKGTISSLNAEGGTLIGENGSYYVFNQDSVSQHIGLMVGMCVNFAVKGKTLSNIYPFYSLSPRSQPFLACMCSFFGAFGIHRFMTGKILSGLLMLILTLSIIGVFITMIWAAIDFIYIVTGDFKDKEGRIVKGRGYKA